MGKTAGDSSSSTAAINAVEQNEPKKYKGVRKRKWGKYVSEIRLPNSRERIWLGSYDTAEKAARAFDAALFCLRGHHAKFNFPNDPPDIPGAENLIPAEIQSVAQHYANQPRAWAQELDDVSPSSDSDKPDPIDWSFLDILNMNGGGHSAGQISDYGFFYPEPSDMIIPPHFEATSQYDDEEDDLGDGNSPYLLRIPHRKYRWVVVSLYGLGQSSPHELAFGVELGSRSIFSHGIRARPIRIGNSCRPPVSYYPTLQIFSPGRAGVC